MAFIEGESLRARLAREGELPVPEAVTILKEVLDALQYAHSHRVVHRDVKPDSVLLTGRHAVVTDFGVAKAVSESTGDSSLTSLGVALGTPAYMDPEQAAADPHVDHRADIYAVGALAYEMSTGRPPLHRRESPSRARRARHPGAASADHASRHDSRIAERARAALPPEEAGRPLAASRRGTPPSRRAAHPHGRSHADERPAVRGSASRAIAPPRSSRAGRAAVWACLDRGADGRVRVGRSSDFPTGSSRPRSDSWSRGSRSCS